MEGDEDYVGVLLNSPIADDAHAKEHLVKTSAYRNITHTRDTVLGLPVILVTLVMMLSVVGTIMPKLAESVDVPFTDVMGDLISVIWLIIPILIVLRLLNRLWDL